jgi:Helicase HerA, central domain
LLANREQRLRLPMDHFEFDPERTVLGTAFTRAGEEELALSELDRLNHLLVIGKTGMGKTQLLRNIILQDIHTGRGVGVLDPHGDLQHELLNEYPRWRARHLVYLDPNDSERVVTFNVLADVPPKRIAATAAEIVGAFKAVWGDIGWGARMERILYFSIAALLEAQNTSLVCLPRILKDERYRLEILEQVHNPIIRGFFTEEYADWDDDYRATAIDPVLNKVEQLLAAPAVCAMLGSVSASIDLREIMDEQKVLICNLAKGNLGAGHVSLIGAMIVSTLSNAAARRGAETIDDEHRGARVPFHLHVDEVENFMTDAFKDILSEARKWQLSLLLAHQFRDQLPPKLRAAVLANVGTIVAFQTMGEDADSLAREIGLNNSDLLTQLRRGEVWIKHATYGGPYHPRLLPPIVTGADGRRAALNENIRRHTYPRARVDGKIRRFLRKSSRSDNPRK